MYLLKRNLYRVCLFNSPQIFSFRKRSLTYYKINQILVNYKFICGQTYICMNIEYIPLYETFIYYSTFKKNIYIRHYKISLNFIKAFRALLIQNNCTHVTDLKIQTSRYGFKYQKQIFRITQFAKKIRLHCSFGFESNIINYNFSTEIFLWVFSKP